VQKSNPSNVSKKAPTRTPTSKKSGQQKQERKKEWKATQGMGGGDT
jgi:hypothetical protein